MFITCVYNISVHLLCTMEVFPDCVYCLRVCIQVVNGGGGCMNLANVLGICEGLIYGLEIIDMPCHRAVM